VWKYVTAVGAAALALLLALLGFSRWSRRDITEQAADLGRQAARRAETDADLAVAAERAASEARIAAAAERLRSAADTEVARCGLGAGLRARNRNSGGG